MMNAERRTQNVGAHDGSQPLGEIKWCRSSFCVHRSSFRHGVTIVEVLISIAVMVIGVLGIASLIPLGAAQVGVANRQDRAAAVGRAAWNEMKARGLLNVDMWVDANNVDRARPFVIDPLGEFPPFQKTNFAGIKQRVRLKSWLPVGNETPGPMSDQLAKYIFIAHDDLVMEIDPKTQESTGQIRYASNGSKRASDDKFSWFATVVPAGLTEEDDDGVQGETFLVTIAVCHGRQKGAAKERTVPAGKNSNLSAGYITLTFADKPSAKEVTREEIRQGNWLLLSVDRVPTWYQVLAVSRTTTGDQVSLAGPEDRDADGDGGPIEVTIIRDVVGVYQYTMNLEDPSLWSR